METILRWRQTIIVRIAWELWNDVDFLPERSAIANNQSNYAAY
jgi:hypothetical protein